jgi:hypothetical protein
MLKGSCLCGLVTFQILEMPVMVANCHCRMCQKQHGAPFATYLSLKKNNLVFKSGQDNLSCYRSSATIERKFCSNCGSNVEWSGHPDYPDWVSVPATLLDSVFEPVEVGNYFIESKCSWV